MRAGPGGRPPHDPRRPHSRHAAQLPDDGYGYGRGDGQGYPQSVAPEYWPGQVVDAPQEDFADDYEVGYGNDGYPAGGYPSDVDPADAYPADVYPADGYRPADATGDVYRSDPSVDLFAPSPFPVEFGAEAGAGFEPMAVEPAGPVTQGIPSGLRYGASAPSVPARTGRRARPAPFVEPVPEPVEPQQPGGRRAAARPAGVDHRAAAHEPAPYPAAHRDPMLPPVAGQHPFGRGPQYAADEYAADQYAADQYAGERYPDRHTPDVHPQSRYGQHPAEQYPADDYRADGYRADGYRADGYRADGYRADGYRADGYRADGYRADGYRADGYRAEQYPADDYRAEQYPTDDHRAEQYGRQHPVPPGPGSRHLESARDASTQQRRRHAGPVRPAEYPAVPRAATQLRADQYPADQYPADEYPANEYPADEYPADAAQYHAARYQAAEYQAPRHPEPQYPAPQYPEPQYPAAQYSAPQYSAPQYPAPQYPAAGRQYPTGPGAGYSPAAGPVPTAAAGLAAGPIPMAPALPAAAPLAAVPQFPSPPQFPAARVAGRPFEVPRPFEQTRPTEQPRRTGPAAPAQPLQHASRALDDTESPAAHQGRLPGISGFDPQRVDLPGERHPDTVVRPLHQPAAGLAAPVLRDRQPDQVRQWYDKVRPDTGSLGVVPAVPAVQPATYAPAPVPLRTRRPIDEAAARSGRPSGFPDPSGGGYRTRTPVLDPDDPFPVSRSYYPLDDDDGYDSGSDRTGPASAFGALFEVVVVVGLALVLALVVKTFFVQAFYIPSESMERTLLVGDRVLVSKLTPGPLDLNHGDVIVFADDDNWLPKSAPPADGPVRGVVRKALTFVGLLPQDSSEHLIKRVIGLPGDTVKCCDAQGRVSVNGVPIDESSYLQPSITPSDTPFTVKVPAGRVWVMGDNRPFSADSRSHTELASGGTVAVDSVVGKAFTIVWPFDRAGGLAGPGTAFADVPSAPGGS